MARFSKERLAKIMARHGADQIKVAVETGVLEGYTTETLAEIFDTVHGIELSEHYFRVASERCKGIDGIQFHLGDSAVVLPDLVAKIEEPAMFYLDAHWFNKANVAESAPFPLWEELACLGKRPYPDLIIVDDAHTFGRAVGHVDEWTKVSMETIVKALGNDNIIEAEQKFDWGVVWRKDMRGT